MDHALQHIPLKMSLKGLCKWFPAPYLNCSCMLFYPLYVTLLDMRESKFTQFEGSCQTFISTFLVLHLTCETLDW